MTSTTAPGGTTTDHVRLMSVAARMYHVQRVRQRDIADLLGVSQASVSRLLRQAQHTGIVQTVVEVPDGLHPELEEEIEDEFGVCEVHVVDVPGGDDAIARTLGRAAAPLFSAGTLSGPVIGFASASPALQEMALAIEDSMPRSTARYVVETLGDLGPPQVQRCAAQATRRLADVLGATTVPLRTPAVVQSVHQRQLAAADGCTGRALRLLDRLDVVFVDVGPARRDHSLDTVRRTDPAAPGARRGRVVGHLNHRFIDVDGHPVATPLDDLVVGLTLAQLAQAHRRVLVAGGTARRAAITAALRGGWVDTLVTDIGTARHLVKRAGRDPLPSAPPTL